jgi:HMG (high mobility group) box
MNNRSLANDHVSFHGNAEDHHESIAFAPPGVPSIGDEDHGKAGLPVKRKRRSPEKPWKKPKDMPKRPLSAYNLFFRDERERLLNPDGKVAADGAAGAAAAVRGKKQKKTSGIGFANLAKTIAAKWKLLEDDVKAPYEKIAAGEKTRYDEAVAAWRVKQAEKKKQAKIEAEEKRRNMRDANPGFSSERSVESFSESSNPYPTEWFHSTMPDHSSDPSERDDSERSNVPHEVDMTSPGAYDTRRAYEIPGLPAAGSWSTPGRPDASYYYNFGDPYMRSSPELPRGAYMRRGLFPQDSRGGGQPQMPPPYAGYPEYYPNEQPPPTMYQQFQPARRLGGDMRMPRAASMPMHQHEFQAMQPTHRSTRAVNFRGLSHPRSASMPLGTGNMAAIENHGPDEPEVEAANISIQQTIPEDRPSVFPEPTHQGGQSNDDSSYVGNAFQSLTDTLDDDAISFITSMKYH